MFYFSLLKLMLGFAFPICGSWHKQGLMKRTSQSAVACTAWFCTHFLKSGTTKRNTGRALLISGELVDLRRFCRKVSMQCILQNMGTLNAPFVVAHPPHTSWLDDKLLWVMCFALHSASFWKSRRARMRPCVMYRLYNKRLGKKGKSQPFTGVIAIYMRS